MASDPAGAPATLWNVSRSLIAGLGNDSPTQSQITAMAAWILSEKPSGLVGIDQASNNPLNVTVNGTPSKFNPVATGIQPGNPIAQFSDITAGIAGNLGWLQSNSNANPMIALFSTPQDVTANQLSHALATPGGGGGIPWAGDVQAVLSLFGSTAQQDIPWRLQAPNGSGPGDIGVDQTGTTPGGTVIGTGAAGATGNTTCVLEQSLSLPGGGKTSSPGDLINYAQCLITHDVQDAVANGENVLGKVLPRVAAYIVGIVLVIVGLVVFVQDKEVPGGEQVRAAAKAAGEAAA